MDKTRVFKLTRRPICPFCNQRVDRDAEVEALVTAARDVVRTADPWRLGSQVTSWDVSNPSMHKLMGALRPFEEGE